MKKLYKIILSGLLLLMITSLSLSAQVSINSNGDLPDNSAMLDVKSTNKGFLPPRVALTAVNSADPVILPATGLLVYNTVNTGTPPNHVLPGYYYWNGTLWVPIATPQGTNPGDMLYWNGLQWLPLPLGSPGQFLQLSQSNIPAWSGPAFAALTTSNVSSIRSTTATSGGNISDDGGSGITARGVCWSTTPNPTTSGNHTSEGSGTGIFVSDLAGLAESTLYYVRAYATNSAGTAYGNQISFSTYATADNDGNYYNAVTIGTQTWLSENLKTTKFDDGTSIPLVTGDVAWASLTTPGYCWYNNDETSNKNTYGGLYNWYAVNTNKLCPNGWNIPTETEWTTLQTYLGGEIAGGKLKETGTQHWLSPNGGATNETGFTALPGGYRNYGFINLNYEGDWWSSTEIPTGYAYSHSLNSNNSTMGNGQNQARFGFSVRCIKE